MSVVRSPVRSVVRPVVRGVFGFDSDASQDDDDMAAPYIAGKIYGFTSAGTVAATASVVNEDRIFPFIPRRNATLDKVCWYRDNTSAGNAYVGVYSSAGILLTDCAVDADTTVGWHAVDTTNLALVSTQAYYLCINVSVDIAGTMTVNQNLPATAGAIDLAYLQDAGIATDLGATTQYIVSKARTNAALLSTLTLSGFTGVASMAMMGTMYV